MSRESKIGVAIPTYKRDEYLRILLNSIPAEINVCISDNGGYVSSELREEFRDRKFIVSETIVPIYTNWNNAIKNLNTEWICLASDDDIFFEGAFNTFEKYLNDFPNAEVMIFGHKNIDSHGKVIGEWRCNKLYEFDSPKGFNIFKYGVDARVIGVFFKKELYEKIGKFDENYKLTACDSYFIQLALLKGKVIMIPEIIVGYRIWENGLTSLKIASYEWINEVIDWQSKIAIELANLKTNPLKIKRINDEVIARNFVSALNSLYKEKKKLIFCIRFFRQFPYPFFATLNTQLTIIKCLIKIGLKN